MILYVRNDDGLAFEPITLPEEPMLSELREREPLSMSNVFGQSQFRMWISKNSMKNSLQAILTSFELTAVA